MEIEIIITDRIIIIKTKKKNKKIKFELFYYLSFCAIFDYFH